MIQIALERKVNYTFSLRPEDWFDPIRKI